MDFGRTMRIIFFGSGTLGLPTLDRLIQSNHCLEAIITQPPQPAGRGRQPKATPVGNWARQRELPLVEVGSLRAPEVREEIDALDVDIFVVVSYGKKLPDPLLVTTLHGAINLHPSQLPKYRGAAPVNWAIINQEKETAVSVIQLSSVMDGGAVLHQRKTLIGPAETAGELHDRLAEMGAEGVLQTLTLIAEDRLRPIVQDSASAMPAPKLTKADGVIDFSCDAAAVAARIRGTWPWPGSVAEFVPAQGKPVRVSLVRAVASDDRSTNHSPGMIDDRLELCCGRGRVRLLEIQPAGKRCISYTDFVNGYRVSAGDRFVQAGGDKMMNAK